MNELCQMQIPAYFWRSGNTAELDFLFEGETGIIPVEVKSADNTQAKSYRQFCKKYTPKMGIKCSMKNMGENLCEGTKTLSIPLFLLWNIKKYLEKA